VFVLTGLGSLGDVLPLLALAEALLTRGHRCCVLSSTSFEALARARGIPFVTVAPGTEENRLDIKSIFAQAHFPSYEPTREFFEAHVLDQAPAVVVNLENISPSNVLAERYGIPVCRIYLAPYWIRSNMLLPWPFRMGTEGPFGRAYLRYTFPAQIRARDEDPWTIGQVNGFRRLWGVRPVRSTRDAEDGIVARIAFFPEWFCERAPDWPAVECVGFPLPPSRASLPTEIATFLASTGERPAIFTPGTAIGDATEFFARARACCEALGRPGLLLSRHANLEPHAYGERMMAWPFIDLDLVLPHAALLIHHGGIGTTARALAAGVPQIIRPEIYDQFDNAQRVCALGVGARIDAREGARSMTQRAREMLGDETMATTLKAVRVRCAEAQAMERCVDTLEAIHSTVRAS